MTILTFYVYALFVVFWLLFLSFLKLQHLFLLQRDADVDRKIQDFVVTKGGIICQFPQKKIDAVIVLLGCFYVFNVSYTQCKAILTFLDQALLESGLGQTLVNVSSLFQWLGKYLSSCWMLIQDNLARCSQIVKIFFMEVFFHPYRPRFGKIF